MAKELQSLYWIEELLPKEHIRKSMFGGFAYYLQEKLVLVMFESTGSKAYKDKKYEFELWNGCMFPAEREHHADICRRYPFLINHPVLPKWLYLPLETENFEDQVESVMRELRRRNPQFGTIPKGKKKTPKKTSLLKTEKVSVADMRKPRMFRDEPPEDRLKTAKKISDLRNFGPTTERHFNEIGVRTVQQFSKLGWKKVFEKLSRKNPKSCHAMYAYAMIGALQNRDFGHISESDKAEAREWAAHIRLKLKKRP